MKVIALVALLGLAQSIRVEDEESLFFQGTIQSFLQAKSFDPEATPPVNKSDGDQVAPPTDGPQVTKTKDGAIIVNGEKLTPMTPKAGEADSGKPIVVVGGQEGEGGEQAKPPTAEAGADGPKAAAKGKMPTNGDITKMGSPQDIAKDPKKMKALQDIIKKIMGVKKGKKVIGGMGAGGKKGKGGMGGGMGGSGGGQERGNGQFDSGPEPPLTKVFENTQLSVKCDKGKCQVKQCMSGKCKEFEKKQQPSMEFQKPDANWDRKMQVMKEKAPVNIGSPPAQDPVPKETQDQLQEGEVTVDGAIDAQSLLESLKITQVGQDFFNIEF